MTQVPVDVEVFLIRVRDGELGYRITRRALDRAAAPDDVALELSGVGAPGICHSTSWRYEGGSVVLTYAALPDPGPSRGVVPLRAPAVVCSPDPLRPSPPELQVRHVAAHAVRHLAYLARTDPVIVALADADGPDGCWDAVRRIGDGVPRPTVRVPQRVAPD